MKILSINTSSKICSVSILEDKNLIIEKHNDDEKTHSQKLMPLIDATFKEANLTLDDIDLLACCQGPGSFTGIRIGISTVKAFADVKNIPIVGVTSLEALAYNIRENALIFSIIDAKNDNVYCGFYELHDGDYNIVFEPISDNINNVIDIIDSVKNKFLKNLSSNLLNSPSSNSSDNPQKIIFVGDGAVAHAELLKSKISNADFACEKDNIQTSISVGLSALDKFNSDSYVPNFSVSPIYLKKSQAERNLNGEK